MELIYDGGGVASSNDLVLLFLLLPSGDGLAANVSASNKDDGVSSIEGHGFSSGVMGLGVSSSSGVTGKGILFLGGVEYSYSYPAEGSDDVDASSVSKGCCILFLLDLN